MKRYRYLLIISCFSFIGITSCKKNFLDIDDYSYTYRQSYVKDLNSMEDFLGGIYILFGSNLQFYGATAYPEVVADNMKPKSNTGPILLPHYSWVQQIDEQDVGYKAGLGSAVAMNPLWKSGYQIIRACSFVIEDIDKYRDENPIKADNIKGQAYGLRSLTHFMLVNTFAQAYNFTADASHLGVPYITSSDISTLFTRQTVGEVYNSMIDDLNNAIRFLPAVVTDIRFMNLNAAKALLARIYLFKEDFANAKKLATEITNQFPLLTISDGYPNELFKFKSPSQTEVLFQLTPQNHSSSSRTLFLGYILRGSRVAFYATNDIVNVLKENPNDIRNAWISSVSGNWFITKFPISSAPEISPAPIEDGAYYSSIIRSSEMFLTVAEAAAKLGEENTARDYLNSIRKRADPSIVEVSPTGSALLDSIYKERRREMAFEGLRMYDLQRWKLGVHRIDVLPGFPQDLPYPNDKAIAPIPPLDVKLAKIQQNPSY